jgi:hypothetical protein
VAFDQASGGERDIERVAQVVIQRVAGQIPGKAALEQRFDVAEGACQRGEVGARIARSEHGGDEVAYPVGVFDVHAVGHVVLTQAVLHEALSGLRGHCS